MQRVKQPGPEFARGVQLDEVELVALTAGADIMEVARQNLARAEQAYRNEKAAVQKVFEMLSKAWDKIVQRHNLDPEVPFEAYRLQEDGVMGFLGDLKEEEP
jgi:50S ribosomal subunit-associated GTPase HflX